MSLYCKKNKASNIDKNYTKIVIIIENNLERGRNIQYAKNKIHFEKICRNNFARLNIAETGLCMSLYCKKNKGIKY